MCFTLGLLLCLDAGSLSSLLGLLLAAERLGEDDLLYAGKYVVEDPVDADRTRKDDAKYSDISGIIKLSIFI